MLLIRCSMNWFENSAIQMRLYNYYGVPHKFIQVRLSILYVFSLTFAISCTQGFFFLHHPDDPRFHTTQVYVRNNICHLGNLTEGMPAPDCPLVPLEPSSTLVSLRSLCQPGRPLVILGGSYTCPLYRCISHVLNDIYRKYNSQIDFYMIQIREAHASDVWPIGNVVSVKEHRTLDERLAAAREMVKATRLEIPVFADTMDDVFLKLYKPWPFRFFVIVDGILRLVGMPKEARYDTTDLVECLDTLLK